jgi:hypothetical protein
MTGNHKDNREALDRLMFAMVDDLLNASEDELIAEILEEGRNPTEEADAARMVIELAARQSGKARLMVAKDALAAAKSTRAQTVVRLDVAEARRRLAAILQQNAGNGVSLAARNESELSDSDVFGMLADFDELGVLPGTKTPDREP